MGYKRRGGTEKGSRFAEDEVLPDCDQSPSPLSLSVVFPLTREVASASWEARVLPTELHRVVCVCVLLRVHSCECVGVSALALTGSPVVILTI